MRTSEGKNGLLFLHSLRLYYRGLIAAGMPVRFCSFSIEYRCECFTARAVLYSEAY